jgi:hypothetical protein
MYRDRFLSVVTITYFYIEVYWLQSNYPKCKLATA